MARRLIVRTRCPICGKQVEAVPDGVLKQRPGTNDAEMVVTRTGYKQYIHSSCWYGMIAKQKKRRNGFGQTGMEQKKKRNAEREHDSVS